MKSRRARPRAALAVAFLAALASARLGAAYEVARPTVEHAVDPLGVDAAAPRLSWRIASDEPGQRQTAWRVLAASSPEALAAERGELWDSGRVPGDRTTLVPYAGRRPAESERVYWSVRSWDKDGRPSAWSAPASWTTGLTAPEDWGAARWITAAGETRLENTLLRREFTVRPGLRRALAHVSGLGHYELFLNGAKAGDDVFSPGWTDYRDTILYDTRDVTALLREGANAAGISLGNGMAHVVRPEGRFAKFKGSFGPQRAILHLRLDYADGATETVATDGTWRTHAGPITFSSIYGGEDFDARREPAGWKLAGYDDAGWTPVTLFAGEGGVLRGQSFAAEPVAPIEVRPVVATRALGPGAALYDFGQNLSFMPRLRVSGPAGSTVRLTGGEVVTAEGEIERGTMGGAHRGSAWWQYTKATDGEETWFPQFYYLGSRYLRAEFSSAGEGGEVPRLEALEQVVVHSTARPAGRFACSDATLNRIRELVIAAQRSNMMSILTDCPHREKLGWLEQNHLNGPALRYEWDIARLAAKNVRDMAEAQTPEGLIPNIAPEYTVFKGTFRAAAEWGASFILVPWQQYVFTGDDGPMREHYEAMRRYFAYLEGRAPGGVLAEGLGDWYDVTTEKPGRAHLTPPALTATAHFYLDAITLAKIAAVLGRDADAAEYRARAEAIRAAFNREFFRPGEPGLYGTGSQTSLALPLALGLVEPEHREAARAALVREIETRGHFSAGAVGTGYMFRALADAGRADLIHRMATRPDTPGYGMQLEREATALAESWTAWTGASQNHFFLGQIVEWLHRDLAGLAPDEAYPGFKHAIIRPRPAPGVEWAEAEHETPHGRLAVRWERKGGRFRLELTVPPNASATVFLPGEADEAARRVESGRHVFEAAWRDGGVN